MDSKKHPMLLTTAIKCAFCLGTVARLVMPGAPSQAGEFSMTRRKTGNVNFHVRLSQSDRDLIEHEKQRTGAESLSEIVSTAITSLLDETDNGGGGIVIVPTIGKLRRLKYRIPDALLERINAACRHRGFNHQQIARSAIAMMAKGARKP